MHQCSSSSSISVRYNSSSSREVVACKVYGRDTNPFAGALYPKWSLFARDARIILLLRLPPYVCAPGGLKVDNKKSKREGYLQCTHNYNGRSSNTLAQQPNVLGLCLSVPSARSKRRNTTQWWGKRSSIITLFSKSGSRVQPLNASRPYSSFMPSHRKVRASALMQSSIITKSI